MKNLVKISDMDYELTQNNKEGFDLEEMKNKMTDYFYDYDYIVGDWAYGKLRLKGFYDEKNNKVKEVNNIKFIDDYFKKYCAFGCRYFILKKVYKK
jgi:uncharacterized protein YutD